MKQVVIIGGGVAGLSALNRLVDLGIKATLIEAGNYPAHKVCGEFFSPECLEILSFWGVEPSIKVEKMSIITDKNKLFFSLPVFAASQSRYCFDLQLVQRAEQRGAIILTNTKAKEILKDRVLLDSGEEILYTDLIVGSGRLFGSAPLQYFGFKGHIKGIDSIEGLEMYSFRNGYAGFVPCESHLVNVACLLRKEGQSIENFLPLLLQRAPHLKNRLEDGELAFDDWLVCQIPALGIKKTPQRQNTYFIGDAAGTVPPASGLGLALAIHSGYMAADYVSQKNSEEFQKDWFHKYKKVFRYGFFLHYLFMTPFAASSALFLSSLYPKLPSLLFKKTRFS